MWNNKYNWHLVVYSVLKTSIEIVQCVSSPPDVTKSYTPEIYIQLYDSEQLKMMQNRLTYKISGCGANQSPTFAGESPSSSLSADSGNSLRLDYSRTECWLSCVKEPMMSEPYFPWRGSHQLHCSRKSWSVLWAKKKKKFPMPKMWLPSLVHPHLCWGAARWPLARRCQRTELKPEPPPRCLFHLVSVMKGSMLIQAEEIICRPSGDYKTMLVLMS